MGIPPIMYRENQGFRSWSTNKKTSNNKHTDNLRTATATPKQPTLLLITETRISEL